MNGNIADEWRTRGFVVLPGFLSGEDLEPALGELPAMFPTPEGFHGGTDERRSRYVEDEFDGIDAFPFTSPAFSLLAVHPKIVGLAETLLGQSDLRLSSAEAWAKYTGATSYDQELHRDYLNQTILVPSLEDRYQHLELFVLLVDVPEELGPPHLVSYEHTADLPMKPNFYPRSGGSGDFVSTDDNSALYDAEQSGAGPAGTVIAFNTRTFHRGTGLRRSLGARYSMQLIYRPAEADWGQRMAWAARSHEPAWYEFVHRATPRQLELFGFPPPGHPYWTEQTLTGIAQRYPTLDLTPWR
ncbi:phytanoyl-CoA dioxygenase family protein [Kribbella sp. NPDC051586]|uniref:phytanoyl-CoA dioxygenase family protein n=1 Tax=Kribbella sp. NPDC051586 TaxID=3364118 RepID=UPI0037A9D32B